MYRIDSLKVYVLHVEVTCTSGFALSTSLAMFTHPFSTMYSLSHSSWTCSSPLTPPVDPSKTPPTASYSSSRLSKSSGESKIPSKTKTLRHCDYAGAKCFSSSVWLWLESQQEMHSLVPVLPTPVFVSQPWRKSEGLGTRLGN